MFKDKTIKNKVQPWLIALLNDPLVKLLHKNSQLTNTQLETILIDILAPKIIGNNMIYEQKAKLRLIGKGVSRGAYNRTLSQARRNIIKSIYTVILLGYLGILETPILNPYLEIAEKIRIYSEGYKNINYEKNTSNEYIRIISILQKQIENSLKALSKPTSISNHS